MRHDIVPRLLLGGALGSLAAALVILILMILAHMGIVLVRIWDRLGTLI